jgi:hypothetical protein
MSDWTSLKRRSQFESHSGTQCSAASPGPVGIKKFEIDVNLRSNQFPEIRKKSKQLYEMAMEAGDAFQKAKRFQRTYNKVQKALNDVSLKLDETGKLTMKFTKSTTADDLVTKAVVSKLADQMKGQMDKSSSLFTSDRGKAAYGKFSLILSNAVTLLEIRKDIDNFDLVNEQMGKRRKEATQKKIKFCLAAIAAARVGTTETPRYTNVYIQLWKDYKNYDAKMEAWYTYVTIEEKLAGTYRIDPEQKLTNPPDFLQ